jgi:hypothetical protein
MFHWEHAPVRIVQKVQQFLAKKKNQVLPRPAYYPEHAQAGYFLFPH